MAVLLLLGFGGWYYFRQSQRDKSYRDSGGQSYTSSTVYDQSHDLGEGKYLTVRLPGGTYFANITATQDGVKVKWVGANCRGSGGEVNTYRDRCHAPAGAQLVIENPTTLGLGANSFITVRVTQD